MSRQSIRKFYLVCSTERADAGGRNGVGIDIVSGPAIGDAIDGYATSWQATPVGTVSLNKGTSGSNAAKPVVGATCCRHVGGITLHTVQAVAEAEHTCITALYQHSRR